MTKSTHQPRHPAADVTRIAVAVVLHEGAVLVGTRAEQQTLGGLAEFPGGKIEPGESPAQAAMRECWEESGVVVDFLRELEQVLFDYEHGTLEITFCLCRPEAGYQPPRGSFEWMDVEQLSQLEFPPANRSVLKLIPRL